MQFVYLKVIMIRPMTRSLIMILLTSVMTMMTMVKAIYCVRFRLFIDPVAVSLLSRSHADSLFKLFSFMLRNRTDGYGVISRTCQLAMILWQDDRHECIIERWKRRSWRLHNNTMSSIYFSFAYFNSTTASANRQLAPISKAHEI